MTRKDLNAYGDLLAEFLDAEKPAVSAQGYVTLSGIARRVLAWFEEEEIDIETAGIQDAVRYLAFLSERVGDDGQPYATGTVHNYLKVARRLFNYLVWTERRETNPFREIRYPRLGEHLSRNVLSEAQMGRLLRELSKFDEADKWYEKSRRYRVHVIAEFLYATGLRIAEACSLGVEDIDLEARLVSVREGKGGKSRTAFLGSYSAEIMRRYLENGRAALMGRYVRKKGGTLFGADKARVADVVNGELASVCSRLELPLITTHGFRHSLGTHLLRSGCDMRHIQAILGHEALATTQIYTRVDKEDLKRSLDEFHPRRWNGRESDDVRRRA